MKARPKGRFIGPTIEVTVAVALLLFAFAPKIHAQSKNQTTTGPWVLVGKQDLRGGMDSNGMTIYILVYEPTNVMYSGLMTSSHFVRSGAGGLGLTEMTDPTTGKPLQYNGEYGSLESIKAQK